MLTNLATAAATNYRPPPLPSPPHRREVQGTSHRFLFLARSLRFELLSKECSWRPFTKKGTWKYRIEVGKLVLL